MVLRSLSSGFYNDYVQLSGNTSKTYGDSNPSVSTIRTSGVGSSNVALGWNSKITAATTVGTYNYKDVVTVTDVGRSAYVDYGVGTLTVTPKTLTATLTGTVSKVYDGTTTASLAGSNFNFSSGDVIGSDVVTLVSPTSGTYASAKAGTGITVTATGLSLTGAAAGNYKLDSSTISAPSAPSPRRR